jgi:V/A-type H+-transporting ATPase subunit K
MEAATMTALGGFGGAAMLSLSALGSALGAGVAAPAAIGAWKKCYAQNKTAPFLLLAFIGAPLSQTIYGMIVMNKIIARAASLPASWPALLAVGIFGGLAMGASAYYQGKAGAAASDALAETGKGSGNYLMALGIIETVAIFVLVFIGKAIS